MGLFRLLLALSVVLVHAGPVLGWGGLSGALAVQTFFVVSGFYMAMVLSTRYTGAGAHWLFLSNRFLRLFPTYWLIAVATFVFVLAWQHGCSGCQPGDAAGFFRYGFMSQFELLPGAHQALAALLNVSLVGQDLTMFTAVAADGSGLHFTANFRNTEHPAYLLMLVPQAWTLSLEIMFYLMAPALNRQSTARLAGIVLIAFAMRAFLHFGLGLHRDPWTYRFFPVELGLFVLGMLAYRWHQRLGASPQPRLVRTVFVGVIGLTLIWPLLPRLVWLHWSFIGLAVLALPFIFRATQHSRADRWVGELSYPVYISHFLVLLLVSPLAEAWGLKSLQSAMILVATLILSAAINTWLAEPIEKLRAARYTRAKIHAAA